MYCVPCGRGTKARPPSAASPGYTGMSGRLQSDGSVAQSNEQPYDIRSDLCRERKDGAFPPIPSSLSLSVFVNATMTMHFELVVLKGQALALSFNTVHLLSAQYTRFFVPQSLWLSGEAEQPRTSLYKQRCFHNGQTMAHKHSPSVLVLCLSLHFSPIVSAGSTQGVGQRERILLPTLRRRHK